MSTRAQTELYTKEMKDILKNLKKRESDSRHRLNKKRTFDEAITENEKLKREILDLKSEKQLFEKRRAFEETYNKLITTITENEKLKHTVEQLWKKIIDLTSELQLHEKRFETIYNELEKEIECVRAEAEGFGEQGGMNLGTGNSQQPPFHVVTRFSN